MPATCLTDSLSMLLSRRRRSNSHTQSRLCSTCHAQIRLLAQEPLVSVPTILLFKRLRVHPGCTDRPSVPSFLRSAFPCRLPSSSGRPPAVWCLGSNLFAPISRAVASAAPDAIYASLAYLLFRAILKRRACQVVAMLLPCQVTLTAFIAKLAFEGLSADSRQGKTLAEHLLPGLFSWRRLSSDLGAYSRVCTAIWLVASDTCAQRGSRLTELPNCIIMGLCFITACKEGLQGP